MLSNNKNIIVGECSNLFAVSPLRFLSQIYMSVIASEAKQSVIFKRLLRFARNDVFYVVSFSRRFIIIFLFLSNNFFASGFTPGDSSKIKYDINDSRNPHCPCHQYQKQADDEYARMQNKEKIETNISSENEVNEKEKKYAEGNKSQMTDRNFGKQNIFINLFGFHYKKKKFDKRNEKRRGHRLMKHKISDKLSRCFHF